MNEKILFDEKELYRYLYNHVSITPKDRSIDSGRVMYEKFAKAIMPLLQAKESENAALKEQLAYYEQDTISHEDYEQIMDSIKNPQYNEKLAEALKRKSIFKEETTCPDCIKLKEQLVEATEVLLKVAGHGDSCPLDKNRNKCDECKEFKQDNHSYCIFFTVVQAIQTLKEGGKE